MNNRDYLRHVVETGARKEAQTPDRMDKKGWNYGFNSFLGI